MADDVLLRFLDADLLQVGGDDTKFKNIEDAAKDLAAELVKSPALATPFALVASDPDAPADDPVVLQALAALKARWATYRNTFASTPVGVVRAMLLEALALASASDDRIGVAFVTSARNVLPFSDVGAEEPVWADLVAEVERRIDLRAEAEWATPQSVALPSLVAPVPAVGSPTVTTATVNRAVLQKKIRAASGPQVEVPDEGTVNTDGNPYWPQGNPAHWNQEFGVRLADAIGGTIEAVVQKIEVALPDLTQPLADFADQIASYVQDGVNAVSLAAAGLDRRTKLLWWKEALYSPSGRLRYRDLPPPTAAALMGFDLHNQVPTFTPGSVTAFLCEAVEALPGFEVDRRYLLSELVADARSALATAPLRAAARALVGSEGRRPVLALVAHTDAGSDITDEAFRAATGVPADTSISLPDWATWVYREMQAARAVADGGVAKKRGKKA